MTAGVAKGCKILHEMCPSCKKMDVCKMDKLLNGGLKNE